MKEVRPSAVREEVLRELMPGERLVWCGMPRGGVQFRASDLVMIPFSLVWAGFAFTWEFLAVAKGAPVPFAFFGVPFVCVGLYITIGRFALDSWARARTAYAVTDRRAFIVSRLLSRSVRSVDYRSCGPITLAERRDGSGSITFGAESEPGRRNQRMEPPRFEFVDGARSVFEKALAQQFAPPE